MNKHKELYSQEEIALMRAAEDAILMGKNRIEELKQFASNADIKRIGVAHCVGMMREAALLKERLSDAFEVITIDCKCGKIPAAELLNDPNVKGTSCNPVGQAAYLEDHNTQLNISMGLCMGHDMIFNMKSKAPTSTLIVKDRQHKHQTWKEFSGNE